MGSRGKPLGGAQGGIRTRDVNGIIKNSLKMSESRGRIGPGGVQGASPLWGAQGGIRTRDVNGIIKNYLKMSESRGRIGPGGVKGQAPCGGPRGRFRGRNLIFTGMGTGEEKKS